MYFKQVELVGFKSFPHKTRLKFEPGVTAVVGPNGCGKSNISDAIRWVLGEQSPKSLRGSSMEDVIFNGTDSVEPINMAEVSLTLSNENRTLPIDYNEITITRRLFRSGEGEYILNRTPVRLKDITNLLMGTGIGTSSYSVIEQGKIDLILSSKPEDRRYIFEEASGITKYKSKKKEALRKLEHTENNLVRINDIINEVERQINSIERHAKKAERYKNDFEMMKELDVKLAVYELRGIQDALEQNQKSLDALCQKEENLRQERDEIAALINKYRQDLDNIILTLTETQRKCSDATLFIDKGKNKVELNEERVNELVDLKAGLGEEIAKLEKKVGLQEDTIEKIRERQSNILKAKENKEKELTQKENMIEDISRQIDIHQKEMRNAKNQTVDLLAFQTKTKNELIKLGADLANRKSRLRRLESEKLNIEEEKNNAKDSLDTINRERGAREKKVEERQRILAEYKARIDSCGHSLEETRKRITANENTLNSLQSKEEILKEMIENFEGFDKGVKAVMERVKEGALNGVVGLVADVIEPECGYELATEVALDKKAQAIIVENREALQGALSFLEEKEGQARFIICDEISVPTNNPRYNAVIKRYGISPLSSFVKTDPSRKGVVAYLLNDIYVVENAEMAYGIQKRIRENIKFVTKDGFIIEIGSVVANFSTKNGTATSIIGRAKKLEETINRKEHLKSDIETLRKHESGQKKTFEELKQEIVSAEEKLKKEEIELANIQSKKETAEDNLKKISDECSVIELEVNEVGELIQEIANRGARLNKELNEKEGEHSRMQEFITSSQDAIQEKTMNKNNLIFEISAAKSEVTILNNTALQEAKNLDRETAFLEELKSQYESKGKNARDSEEKITQLLAEIEDLQKRIKSKVSEEAQHKEGLKVISEKKSALSQDLQNKEKISREKEKSIEEWRNEIRNLQIKNRESELKVVNIKDRMREAYKLNIQEVDMEIEEGLNLEETRNQIEVLRIKLEKLGPVNLVAIEEHKELEERFSFLTQQQEDLIRAKESLHKAITKINKTTRNLFTETFQKIQVEFKSYFRMLFGGGHAELLLLDESDVLESGIEIVARPPGKKLQNLLLLSGGEKALTAIALLFAIFRVKPSPFCILDEVDAPLDESNIGRFIRILQEFLKTSQFIIITHSKKTMQMADILYGITMQEKGISRIVSVKFAEDKTTPPKKEEVLV